MLRLCLIASIERPLQVRWAQHCLLINSALLVVVNNYYTNELGVQYVQFEACAGTDPGFSQDKRTLALGSDWQLQPVLRRVSWETFRVSC